MSRILLTMLMSAVVVFAAHAQDGYNIKLNFTDAKSGKISLAHYYGKPLPTIYKVDSAEINEKGVAVLKNTDKVIGGIYIVILQESNQYFEFLLDNGESLNITVDAQKLPLGVTYKSSPVNDDFMAYTRFLSDIGQKHQKLGDAMSKATTKKDTTEIQNQYRAIAKEVTEYRRKYISTHPNTLLTNIFNALELPEFPRSNIDVADRDENWYRTYKSYYWDNVDFGDERLVYTPLLGSKMDEFFSKYVSPIPDTFNKEADQLIEKARASKEVFKYVVHWLTTYAQESDIMGMDAVFVHVVENYYMKGDAFWLNSGTLQKYIDRAKSIAPNVIGNIAPELKMTKKDGGTQSLHGVDAKYTLLVFWSPDCGHCREEIPRIDSTLKAEGLYKKGVKVVGFNTDRDDEKWKEEIKKNKLDNWIHVYDPEKKSDFRAQYDVYGTPSVYLLDDRKIIQGKKLDHKNMLTIIKILEEEATSKK